MVRTTIKAGDYVMVRFEASRIAPVSAHKTHLVLEVYPDEKMLLKGFPEPVSVKMFDRMVINKKGIKAW
ncbi:hypothetical protein SARAHDANIELLE_74 [Hafnia phage vB_HpaM_SarahDanielle]|uniref:Uncharacterized protein n=1 Tax=Hafnia phage vB_HpaM_SarahDanielle TaxID=2836113 RepID=A0AAE7WA80_9CAUD|nr:hypothetical protein SARAHDANIELLE_74 [Hafnia phage vB_HpaM_SarahDanielle]